jgi:hypothetical protein
MAGSFFAVVTAYLTSLPVFLTAQPVVPAYQATEILVPGADTVVGHLMSDRGDVVVEACAAQPGSTPACGWWLWREGSVRFLANSAWSVQSISPNGIVAGVERSSPQRAAIFFGGAPVVIPGLTGVASVQVNSFGHVAGMARQQAFLWRNGQLINPAGARFLRSRATDLNDRGQVVGVFDRTPFTAFGANGFLWWAGTRFSLHPSDDASFVAINEVGHIAQAVPHPPGSLRVLTVLRDGQEFALEGLDRLAGFPAIMDLNNRGDVAAPAGIYLANGSAYENRPIPSTPCRFFPTFTCTSFVALVNDDGIGVIRLTARHEGTGFEFPDSAVLWDASNGALGYLQELAPGVCPAFPDLDSRCVDARPNNQGQVLVNSASSRAFVLTPVS